MSISFECIVFSSRIIRLHALHMPSTPCVCAPVAGSTKYSEWFTLYSVRAPLLLKVDCRHSIHQSIQYSLSGVSRISARGVLKVRPHTKSGGGGGGGGASGPIYEKWVPGWQKGTHLPCGYMEQLRVCPKVLCNSQEWHPSPLVSL